MKQRLDQYLSSQGLTQSRSQAENLIRLGQVTVNGKAETKPGFMVAPHHKVEVNTAERYVSRAGLKLASVAQLLRLDFTDKVVLDVGSSTGGFTDYALQHGARKVIAVDVGTDQMHPSLRDDPRIELYEKTDIRSVRRGGVSPSVQGPDSHHTLSRGPGERARISRQASGISHGSAWEGQDPLKGVDESPAGYATGEPAPAPFSDGDVPVRASQAPQADETSPVEWPLKKNGAGGGERGDASSSAYDGSGATEVYPVAMDVVLSVVSDIVVIDVSFISLRDVLPHIATLVGKKTQIAAMVKPQFEAGQHQVNKGVIKNDAVRRQILRDFELWARQYFTIHDKRDSEVAGAKGNRERFYRLSKIG